MASIEITFALQAAPALEIVWRNPNRLPVQLRRHSFEHSVYTVQEFVHDGPIGHWSKLAEFEVAVGGRAA